MNNIMNKLKRHKIRKYLKNNNYKKIFFLIKKGLTINDYFLNCLNS